MGELFSLIPIEALLALLGIVVAALLVILFIYFWKKEKQDFGLNLKLLEIKLPKASEDEKKDLAQSIAPSEQLFASLLSIKTPFVFETSVHHTGEEIHFYIAVPRSHVDFASRQIQGLFPDAQVLPASDYTVFSPDGGQAASYVKLQDAFILPLRTYTESTVDTFAPIISTLSKLTSVGEGGSVQVLVSPALPTVKNSVTNAIEQMKKGAKLKDVLKLGALSLSDFKKVVSIDDKKDQPEKVIDDEGAKALQSKINKPLLNVSVRLVAAAPDRDRAEDILMAMSASFGQFTAPIRNSLLVVKPSDPRKLLYQYSFRQFEPEQAMILNTEELASIFHLPTYTTDIPRIKWLSTKEAPPPPNLPEEGVVVGESHFRGEKKMIHITADDRRRHMYIIGQTGTGKSVLMRQMAYQDMVDGKGVCVIDPHGELIDDILAMVPKERIDDVIVFNPGDLERPLGMNMLEYDFGKPEQKTFIVNEIQSIFNSLFDSQTMGPMFEQYMRYTLLLLMEDMQNEPATLMEVPRIFTDEEFRKRKLARCKNPSVLDFWLKEAPRVTGETSLANMATYITSKFGNFIANDYVRPIIAQPKSAFNFRTVMDEGKILLVNLAKGRIGDLNASLLGMIITGRILMAALSRGDISGSDRKDFYFYIDEFQNFSTDSIATILSEARKYKLNLILAHQFIAQLKDEIREAVFGNVGSMVAFRVGAPDTEVLLKQFAPEFDDKDLINLEVGNAIVKLLMKGQPSKPFNLKTIYPKDGSKEVAEKLKELSRLVYGKELAVIEQEIYERLRN